MTSQNTENATENHRRKRIDRLRELIAALDRRVPHPEREDELRIARDSAVLKKKAQERIAQHETGPHTRPEL